MHLLNLKKTEIVMISFRIAEDVFFWGHFFGQGY